MDNCLFEKYKHYVMQHGRCIYATLYYTSMAKIFAYPPSQYAFLHWKCVLRCCENCLCIDIPYQESDIHHSITYTSIRFHIYHLISIGIVHRRHSLDEKKMCRLCLQYPATMSPAKLYTRKELVMMETSIDGFYTSYYITAIKKLVFHFLHVRILGTNHCVKNHREAFKYHINNQDVLCHHDYEGE